MKLFINTGKKSVIAIEVNCQDSIKKVKQIIMESDGNDTDKKFILMFNLITLEDEKIISDYNIPNQSTLYRAQNRNKYEIMIKQLEGATFPLQVECNQNIFQVKQQIEMEYGIPYYRQKIIFSGKQLDDQRTLCEYSISKGSILYLVLKKAAKSLIVNMISGEQIKLNIEQLSRISEVKVQIQKATGFEINKQILIFQGEQLQDQKAFLEYNILDEAIISVIEQKNEIL